MYKYSPFQINSQLKSEEHEHPSIIMQKLLDRKKTALDFHRTLMNIFRLLNMKGFKEMQKYHFCSELDDFLELEKHYIYYHHKMPCSKAHDIELNPHNIKQLTDIMTLSTDKKRAIIKSCFDEWKKWEYETKEHLKHFLAELSEQDCYEDVEIVDDELEDVIEEIHHIDKILIKLNDVDWCIKYMYDMQYWLKEKYKKKMEEMYEE